MAIVKCPDCYGDNILDSDCGNGECKPCRGYGYIQGFLEPLQKAMQGEDQECPVCHGTGICQTCKGDGFLDKGWTFDWSTPESHDPLPEPKEESIIKAPSTYSPDSLTSGNESYSPATTTVGIQFRKILGFTYWALVASFWIWNIFICFQDNPQQAANVTITTLEQFWSPTNDPVLNFFIDTVLVVVGIALVPGIIVSGLILGLIIIGIVIAVYIAIGLVALAEVSATGAIVSASIIGVILYFGGKFIIRRFSR